MTKYLIVRSSRSVLSIVLIAFCMLDGFGQSSSDDPQFAFYQNERLGRGINIMGYDPIWNDFSEARIQPHHFKKIKEAGFDNVRLKISPFRFSRDEKFTIDPKFFEVLDWGVNQALANDLMVIVDFHEHGAMGDDPIGTQDIFLAMWEQIATYCKDYPQEVVFEVANEPNMKAEIWNDLHARAYKVIRVSNPERTLLIGTVYGNQIKNLKDLSLPEEDRNIIVAVHYYSPIQFTHQGAPWSKNNKDLSGITWDGTPEQKNGVKQDFNIASDWALENNRPITLGEFGVYGSADLQSRVNWSNYITRQADMRGWSWSYWQFDKDFIVYDIDKDDWFYPIRDAILPNPQQDFQTVMGPIKKEALGFCLTHEHIFSNFGEIPPKTSIYEEEQLLKQVIPYLKSIKELGVESVFDCTASNFGRRPDLLRQLAQNTGVNILTNTGWYGAASDRYVPKEAYELSPEEIAAIWIAEFVNGIGGAGVKPAFIKLAFDEGAPSSIDLKLFEAGIITHQQTGMTLAVHTGNNRLAAAEQITLLDQYGVDYNQWIWVHADKFDDTEYLMTLASRGAWISLDGINESNIDLIVNQLKSFQAAGLLHRVLLSHDGNSFTVGGAIRPYDGIMKDLVPTLLKQDFTESDIQQLLNENPVVAFSISKPNLPDYEQD
ncbi:MAG: cellulase family glycosylhydrolase [Marinoscillum sp.]